MHAKNFGERHHTIGMSYMSHIILPNSTYLFAFKAAQSHATSSSSPWLPQTEQEHHSFTVPPHTTVPPAPCSLPPRFCMELLSISQSRCSSVSHCLTEEWVIAHWLLHGNSPWICLNIVQYTLRPLTCLGNNLFTSHIPSHSTAWVLLMEHLLCDLSDKI